MNILIAFIANKELNVFKESMSFIVLWGDSISIALGGHFHAAEDLLLRLYFKQ